MSLTKPQTTQSETQGDLSSYSLPAWIYYNPEFLALEREHLFMRSWQFVCHTNDIPNPGDYRSIELLGETAFVVRDKDGRLRAFHNVCRHRASRLLDGKRVLTS